MDLSRGLGLLIYKQRAFAVLLKMNFHGGH